ncbi:MAG: UDP-N-acetylglucosamine--N-acetylmuramyl-(pentapeptide) pyrophosphoryl-undecaprenol N-acetylglucosamine transferase [bacterium]
MRSERRGRRTILLAVGGTGGHIYPAVAVGERVRELFPEVEVWFAGRPTGQEQRVAQKRGFRYAPISAARFPSGISPALLLFVLRTIAAFVQACLWVRRIRPCLIVGFGGYVSFPVIAAGIMGGVPVFLQEQNVVPGKVNRLLSKWARGMFTSFEETEGMVRCAVYQTGTPTRFEGKERRDAIVCRKKLGLEPARKTIFAFGGSQGAASINRAVMEFAEIEKDNPDAQVLHLTGEREFDEYKKRYLELLHGEEAVEQYLSEPAKKVLGADDGLKVRVLPYLEEMDIGYGAADVVLCRAGAATLAELMDFGVAAVLVPYPYAAEAHQEKNAEIMERSGAALVISNGALSGKGLTSLMGELFKTADLLDRMAQKSRALRGGNATESIVEVLSQYIRG